MKTSVKIFFIVVGLFLLWVAWVVSSVIGGMLAAGFGVVFHLSAGIIGALAWYLPKFIFLLMLYRAWVVYERKRDRVRAAKQTQDPPPPNS
jgi:hypothetical protein